MGTDEPATALGMVFIEAFTHQRAGRLDRAGCATRQYPGALAPLPCCRSKHNVAGAAESAEVVSVKWGVRIEPLERCCVVKSVTNRCSSSSPRCRGLLMRGLGQKIDFWLQNIYKPLCHAISSRIAGDGPATHPVSSTPLLAAAASIIVCMGIAVFETYGNQPQCEGRTQCRTLHERVKRLHLLRRVVLTQYTVHHAK